MARWLRSAISRRIAADFAEIGGGGVGTAGFFATGSAFDGFRAFASDGFAGVELEKF